MSRGVRLVSLVLLMVLGLLAGAEARAQPEPPSPAAASLLSATGAEYLAERDAVLALPQSEFDAVVAALRGIPGSYRPAALADAVALRRTRPDWAAEFDAMPQVAWDNAAITASGGRAVQMETAAPDPLPRFAPFIVEYVLKRSDARPEVRSAFVPMLPQSVETMLAVLETPEVLRNDFGQVGISAGYLAESTGDGRLPAALAAAFHRYREHVPEDTMSPRDAIWRLRYLDTPEALAAAQAIVASERTRMENLGLAPWDDVDAREIYATALREQTQQRSAAARRRERLSVEAEADLRVAIEAAKVRKNRRVLWEHIHVTLTSVEALRAGGQ